MSNLNKASSENKQLNKKRDIKSAKQSPVKIEPAKNNLQRSKITLNWNQFLQQQNSNITHTLKKDQSLFKHTNKIDKLSKASCPMTPEPIQQYSLDQITYVDLNTELVPGYNSVAIDCEMVGIGDGRENMLARVSLVDEFNRCLYDTFVQPTEPVIDYRTMVSGVRPHDMNSGKEFHLVQDEVFTIIQGKLLIGHAIFNDLKVLKLSHSWKYTRDTSKYKKFRELYNGSAPSLKNLARDVLGLIIQDGEHNSIHDAYATMNLYLKYKTDWEKDLRRRHHRRH